MKEGRKTVHRILFTSSLLFVFHFAWTQTEKPKQWFIDGYIKNLQTLLFFNDAYFDTQSFQLVDTFLQDNLIHNRLNFKWYINSNWSLKADLRSRIFFGDLVKSDPKYAALIDNINNDHFDLSLVLLDQDSWVIHSMLDRFYLEYIKNDWEIRVGRQRINWGISTVWNPNDLFNAFNFTDFDYEERPGADGVRIKYYTGFASSIELAFNTADAFNQMTIAGLWKFNQWNYDFQVLTAYFDKGAALGGGWAGNLKNAGFKGEFTYFIADEENSKNAFSGTVGIDYSFSNSLYVNAGYLYGSLGGTRQNVLNLFDFELSARNLYPYRHAIFLQGTYPITPLLNSGLAIIYSPVKVHPVFINPTITYSVKENWDLDLIGQIVLNNQENYTSPIQAIFLRTKFSY